jgi:hypothetical protein
MKRTPLHLQQIKSKLRKQEEASTERTRATQKSSDCPQSINKSPNAAQFKTYYARISNPQQEKSKNTNTNAKIEYPIRRRGGSHRE